MPDSLPGQRQGPDHLLASGPNGETLHPVQQAWLDIDVPQCGFCQPGQIMAAVDLLSRTRNPSDADIDAIENMCRCGIYGHIRQAIKAAAAKMP